VMPHSPWRSNLRCEPSSVSFPLRKREPLALEQARRRRLAVQLAELGLVVKQIDLARRPGHEQEDDVLGAGWRGRRFQGCPSELAGHRGGWPRRRSAGSRLASADSRNRTRWRSTWPRSRPSSDGGRVALQRVAEGEAERSSSTVESRPGIREAGGRPARGRIRGRRDRWRARGIAAGCSTARGGCRSPGSRARRRFRKADAARCGKKTCTSRAGSGRAR
jgi:hypothetical protein